MNSKVFLSSIFLYIFNALIQSVKGAEVDLEARAETVALTRDHLGRENPDALLNGFIPVWAIIIYIIAATFLVVAILTGFLYLIGCRNPHKKQYVTVVH